MNGHPRGKKSPSSVVRGNLSSPMGDVCHPVLRCSLLRVAHVILARSPGPCEVVWGLVRGLGQSSCLAELLAITVALASFFLCHCFL